MDSLKFLSMRAITYIFGPMVMVGCLKIDGNVAVLNGDTPSHCEQTPSFYTSFAKIPQDCQKSILSKISEFDIAKLLHVALREKADDISGFLSYLGQRALPMAPVQSLSGLKPDLDEESKNIRLGQIYVRNYFRFFLPSTNKPLIRLYDKFCPRIGRYESDCQFVLPLVRYGLIGFKKGGRISTISAFSGQRHEIALNGSSEKEADHNLIFKAVSEYKENHFIILLHEKNAGQNQDDSKFILVNAQLENYDNLKILNRVPLQLPNLVTTRMVHLTSSGDKFIVTSYDNQEGNQINVGSWSAKPASISTKPIRFSLNEIWPYSESQIIVRQGFLEFLVSLDNPVRLHPLPKPFSDLVPFDFSNVTSPVATSCPNSLQAKSRNGMVLSINQGEFGSQFFGPSDKPLTDRVPFFKSTSNHYDFLVEITLGLWGAVDSSGDLVVIDGWSDR